MIRDIGQLIAGVSAVAGGQIAIVCAPDVHAKLMLELSPTFPYPIYSTTGLASGFIMAIALPALASAVDPVPRFSITKTGAAHFEDTSPLPLATSTGTPFVAPQRSFFQTATLGVKMVLQVAWIMRVSGGVSWTSAITW